MAGIGDRMDSTGMICFDADGYPIEREGCPVPDDETLERLRKQAEEWARDLPNSGTGAKPRPLHWRRRPDPAE